MAGKLEVIFYTVLMVHDTKGAVFLFRSLRGSAECRRWRGRHAGRFRHAVAGGVLGTVPAAPSVGMAEAVAVVSGGVSYNIACAKTYITRTAAEKGSTH